MPQKVFVAIKDTIIGLRKRVFTGITMRWIFNVFGMVLAFVVFVSLTFCMLITNFYHSTVTNKLVSTAEASAKYFDFVYKEHENRSALYLVNDFDNKAAMEMQVCVLSGRNYSSTGYNVNERNFTPDVLSAKEGRASSWVGINPMSDEHIISVSIPLWNDKGELFGALRLISSLENVDRALISIYWIVCLFGFVIVSITAFSGIYFIKSIVVPVNQINNAALEISRGNLATHIDNKNKNDEIGELCNSINNMAYELSAAEKLKSDFISQISHELRTPITAIRGWSETLLASTDTTDAVTRRAMDIIHDETSRLSKMVEEMLDMSRMRSGRIKLAPVKMDIIAEFEDTVFMMSQRASGEQVVISYEASEDIVYVMGDKDKLKQVFFNIIDNAIKHSNSGGKIEINAFVADQKINLTVEDFGEGISRDDLPYVKEMFYKGSSQKRGSGIGLGVSDEIIKLHGGVVDIESEIGIGTKVTVKLPIFMDEEDKNATN